MDKQNTHINTSNQLRLISLLFIFGISILGALAQPKPNILWITMEDTSPHFIGCYGNKEASTPVIDKLASEGVRFTNSFSTGTVCSASRSAIITGVHTFKMGTGHHRSNYSIPAFIKGFPYFLKQEGYYVSNNSKTDYNVANMRDFVKEAWNESSATATWKKRQSGQAFFSVFNFTESHQSRTMSQSYDWYVENVFDHIPADQRIADEAFDMPPFYNDTPEMRKHFARVYNSIKLADIRIGHLLEELEKDNLRDSTIIFLYADHGEGIPRGKTNGINLGYRVPFVVWFPEMYKHLSPWGKAGIVTDELIDFKDLAPTILSLAGAEIPEHMVGRVLIGEDRSPMADHLVLSADRADNGPDLVRSITDGRFMYSHNYLPYIPTMRSIRYIEIGEITQEMRSDLTKGNLDPLQKSLFDVRPTEYLYDIENDLWETNNLANHPDYKEVLEKMRQQLDESIVNNRDVHFVPEYEIALISEKSNAYEFRLTDDNYPIKEVYAAAALSGKRSAEVTKKQIELLQADNRFVRYWAILGLCSQQLIDLAPYSAEITKAMADDYPPVAVLASSLACQYFNDKQAEEQMIAYCKSDHNELAHLAINQLLYHKEIEPFKEAVLEAYNDADRNYAVRGGAHVFMRKHNYGPKNYNYMRKK